MVTAKIFLKAIVLNIRNLSFFLITQSKNNATTNLTQCNSTQETVNKLVSLSKWL